MSKKVTIEGFVVSVGDDQPTKHLLSGETLIVIEESGQEMVIHRGTAKSFLESITTDTILEVLRDRLKEGERAKGRLLTLHEGT